MIFVFGSNLRGSHGRGAAKFAFQYRNAVRGRGMGIQGQAYAIPTKDEKLRPLPLDVIQNHVRDFLAFAAESPAAAGSDMATPPVPRPFPSIAAAPRLNAPCVAWS